MFVAAFRTQRNGKRPHSPKNCLPGSGWTQVSSDEHFPVDLGGAQPIAGESVYRGRTETTRAWCSIGIESRDRIVANEYRAKFWVMAGRDPVESHRHGDGSGGCADHRPEGGRGHANGGGLCKGFFRTAAPIFAELVRGPDDRFCVGISRRREVPVKPSYTAFLPHTWSWARQIGLCRLAFLRRREAPVKPARSLKSCPTKACSCVSPSHVDVGRDDRFMSIWHVPPPRSAGKTGAQLKKLAPQKPAPAFHQTQTNRTLVVGQTQRFMSSAHFSTDEKRR